MFARKIEKTLVNYYQNRSDKILYVYGARQIGKTYIITNTAKEYFENVVEINFRQDINSAQIYKTVKNSEDFYLQLSALYGNLLGNYNDTLIVLDDIQVYPHLLPLLRDFCIDKKYRFIACGAIPNMDIKQNYIPTDFIIEYRMFPMDFEEFLFANNVGKNVIEYLKKCYMGLESVSDGIHKVMLDYFKKYLIVGGLPYAVDAFVNEQNVFKVREYQEYVKNLYLEDIYRYENNRKRFKISAIYNSLPDHMGEKVKRIQANKVNNKKGVMLTNYMKDLDYLLASNITLGSLAVSDPFFPLLSTSAKNLIKLYYNDVGILSSILYSKNIMDILNKEKGNGLGSLYETAVATELAAHGHNLFYYDRKGVGYVDFILDDYNERCVMPVEVRSGNTLNLLRAILKFVQDPETVKRGVTFTNKNKVSKDGNLYTYPIYMIMFI